MADEKKPSADKPAAPTSDPVTDLIWIIAVLLFAMYALNGVISYIGQKKIFSSGWRGLTEKGLVLSYTRPIASLLNPLNTRFLVTSNSVPIYDSPGGKQIALKNLKDEGVIIGGPVSIYDDRYWQVQFDDGTTGWVNERYIASLEGSKPNLFVRFLFLFWKIVSYFKYIVILFSILLFLWVVYLYREISKLLVKEKELLYPSGVPDEHGEVKTVNPKWEKILEYLNSENENDWRHAIIEADIMLSELLDKLILSGETMGDKLKVVEKDDFLTLDNAWEGHKYRNQIAHEGSEFRVTQREAKRIIDLYRTVFDEFKMI